MTLVAFDVDRMYSDEVQTHTFRDGEIKTGLCTRALIKEVIPSLMKRSPMIKDLLSERYKQLDELKLKSPEITKNTERSNIIGND